MNHFFKDISVKVDLSNYATKADLKNATGIDTSKLAARSDLVSLKAEVDQLDIEKLIPVSVDLSKLSDGVKNYIVEKSVYIVKVNNIDTGGFIMAQIIKTRK